MAHATDMPVRKTTRQPTTSGDGQRESRNATVIAMVHEALEMLGAA